MNSNLSWPNKLDLPIGFDGISCLAQCFDTDNATTLLAVGTSGGRVRLYTCSDPSKPLMQKRWHKTIRCLSFMQAQPNLVVSASSQSGLKIHDIQTGQRCWMHLKAHGKSPISSLLVLTQTQWVTGDEDGVIKLWDSRKPDATASLTPNEDSVFDQCFSAINDLAVGSDTRGILLAAIDDGTLATYNIRRRRFDMVSETLGFSARTVAVVKNNRKVLVGTDEGVISVFNWKEFGNLCDRFPVHSLRPSKCGQARTLVSGSNSVEKIVKLSEDLVAVATDDGMISAFNILPNRLLGPIGSHFPTLQTTHNDGNDADDLDSGADCLSLCFDPHRQILISGCPTSSTVRFWPVEQFYARAEAEESDLRLPKKQRKLDRCKLKGSQARRLILLESAKRADYLSGLLPEPDQNGNDGDDDDADSSDGEENGDGDDSDDDDDDSD